MAPLLPGPTRSKAEHLESGAHRATSARAGRLRRFCSLASIARRARIQSAPDFSGRLPAEGRSASERLRRVPATFSATSIERAKMREIRIRGTRHGRITDHGSAAIRAVEVSSKVHGPPPGRTRAGRPRGSSAAFVGYAASTVKDPVIDRS